MGNEQSNLSGLEVDEKAIEVTDFWTHHSATFNSGNSVSIFIGEPLVSGSLWLSQTPLEKATKNLMVYRHPCILKYISSWHKSSKFYLAVEDVKPLSLVLSSQNTLQICIGLHSILKALCFLHEKAYASHNNVCVASIYVTQDGNWRLGGMEYLCRFIDLTEDYLCKTRAHRYDKCVDVNESKSNKDKNETPHAIDCYAFGVLVNEVLQNKTSDDIPSLAGFRDLCKNQLQHTDVSLRPKLSSLLEHEFFTHDFIAVHSFLTELPLKSDESKISFFSSLANKLRTFNETVTANQLGSLLLSRMVLLDKTAQQDLLPLILCPRQGGNNAEDGLFSTDNFKQYLVPRLLQIFCVRDAQIRLLLLDHFVHYMKCFTVDELQSQILPELLVGIKDTSDHLVAVTLRALADMVPVLGAATVIGGKRAKLFNDGRPITHPSKRSRRNSRRSQDPAQGDSSSSQTVSVINSVSSSTIELNQDLELPERPSPDGEEGETSTEDIEQSAEDDLDNWEDWDINEGNPVDNDNTTGIVNSTNTEEYVSQITNFVTHADDSELENHLSTLNLANRVSSDESLPLRPIIPSQNTHMPTLHSNTDAKFSYLKKKLLPDISELDIKSQIVTSMKRDEFDFFQDMEPVIQTSTKYFLTCNDENVDSSTINEIHPKKLDLGVAETEKQEEGWGDDFDWD